MKAFFTIASLLIALGSAKKDKKPDCEITKSVSISFYGQAESSGSLTYSECGRINAGGRGTYESPLSMAAAPGTFSKCEIVFVPYLLKYVRYEDLCTSCVSDWSNNKLRMQIWMGNEISGGTEQSDCARSIAPSHGIAVIRNPGPDYRIDSTPLFDKSARSACSIDHRYLLVNNEVFCYGRRDKTAGRKRKKAKAGKQVVIQASLDEEVEEPQTKMTKAKGGGLVERKPVLIL